MLPELLPLAACNAGSFRTAFCASATCHSTRWSSMWSGCMHSTCTATPTSPCFCCCMVSAPPPPPPKRVEATWGGCLTACGAGALPTPGCIMFSAIMLTDAVCALKLLSCPLGMRAVCAAATQAPPTWPPHERPCPCSPAIFLGAPAAVEELPVHSAVCGALCGCSEPLPLPQLPGVQRAPLPGAHRGGWAAPAWDGLHGQPCGPAAGNSGPHACVRVGIGARMRLSMLATAAISAQQRACSA